jgi:hypothetical protein
MLAITGLRILLAGVIVGVLATTCAGCDGTTTAEYEANKARCAPFDGRYVTVDGQPGWVSGGSPAGGWLYFYPETPNTGRHPFVIAKHCSWFVLAVPPDAGVEK